eukprot:CAMPEP_0198599952 /NCGR_PEP_ID=MMETSP1462-20131121/147590_1 /TAXON_ID=1333877 /ORGANISM="Brandtodinium nutriculum, Strain RCC3387" /LENGTH=122 /DNA_ID=CAMNT_0044331653 /DNA_START=200 /DNA_END=564 /DNA_ORIENTATION=+
MTSPPGCSSQKGSITHGLYQRKSFRLWEPVGQSRSRSFAKQIPDIDSAALAASALSSWSSRCWLSACSSSARSLAAKPATGSCTTLWILASNSFSRRVPQSEPTLAGDAFATPASCASLRRP